MKEVEQLVYARLIADAGLAALVTDTTHILHAYQNIIPKVPYLTFGVYSDVKGTLGGDFQRSHEVFIQFNILAVNYMDIASRLRQLFDGYRFDVPSNFTDVGQCRGVFDLEGPDLFDEVLEVQSKQVRYRFFVTMKAWNPITA